MLRVGFEPTPFRTRTLIWRLRPSRPSQHMNTLQRTSYLYLYNYPLSNQTKHPRFTSLNLNFINNYRPNKFIIYKKIKSSINFDKKKIVTNF